MNTVILKPQKLTMAEYNQIRLPYQGKKFKKVFFQPELRDFINGDAIFGLVAYGGYKQFGKRIGPPKQLRNLEGGADFIWSVWPLSFGNLEFKTIPEPDEKEYKAGNEQTEPKEIPGKILSKIDELLKKYEKDEKKLEDIELVFKAKVSDNPHAYYEVTLESTTEIINPSPPDPPSDY